VCLQHRCSHFYFCIHRQVGRCRDAASSDGTCTQRGLDRRHSIATTATLTSFVRVTTGVFDILDDTRVVISAIAIWASIDAVDVSAAASAFIRIFTSNSPSSTIGTDVSNRRCSQSATGVLSRPWEINHNQHGFLSRRTKVVVIRNCCIGWLLMAFTGDLFNCLTD